MKKWFNVELGQENAERLGAYLKKYEYKYEASKVDSFIRSLPEF